MAQSVSIDETLRRYPELKRLLDLNARGWEWGHVYDDVANPDTLVRVVGWRVWSEGSQDNIAVESQADVRGLRINGANRVVWERNGGLDEVVHGLLTLPAPGTFSAPHLAIASAAPRLWTP